jgi:hypothetical protein
MDLLSYQFCTSIAGCTVNFATLSEFVPSDREIAEAAFIVPCLLLDMCLDVSVYRTEKRFIIIFATSFVLKCRSF